MSNSAAETRFADVGGRRTRYRISGSGPGVLLLHGIGRSLEDWVDVESLFALTHTVYALDLAGYGESAAVDGRTTLTKLARAALAFLAAIAQPGPVAVVGNSLGGAVALQLAALAPTRVSALVLVDPAGFGKEVTIALRVLALPIVGRRLARPSRKNALMETQGIFRDQSLVTQDRIELALRLALRPGGTKVLRDTASSLGSFRGVKAGWRRRLLAQVAPLGIPTLVVWGEKDRILPATQLNEVRRVFPHAEWHLFERTGHMPQLEKPQEFAALALDFLHRTTAEEAPA
ncbi:MAG: alpha/beta fold hydrolase [Actinomycetota bacterium]|nr:alpha/beta fold hydrolase [Actinomycetota bacterium]